MRGIIYKDLHDNFGIWKNLISYFLLSFCVIIWTILSSNSEYSFVLLILTIDLTGACAIESSSEQDEAADFNRLLLSFPVTKREVVTAKYLLALIFIAAFNLVSLCVVIAHVFAGGVLSFSEVLPLWGLGFCISLLFTGISYIGYMVMGKRKGTWFYVFMVIAVACGYGSMSVIYGIDRLIEMDKTLLLCAGVPSSMFVLFLSYIISIRVYKRKYS